MRELAQRQLLQRLALRLLALLLLGIASCRGSEFLEGDFIPAARRGQFHGVRRHCRLLLEPPVCSLCSIFNDVF